MSTQEETEDSRPDEDQEAAAAPEPEPAPEPPAPESDVEDARLEEITERIEKARTQAEEAGVLVDEDQETFVESGTTEEDDDQTIAPPG